MQWNNLQFYSLGQLWEGAERGQRLGNTATRWPDMNMSSEYLQVTLDRTLKEKANGRLAALSTIPPFRQLLVKNVCTWSEAIRNL